MAKNPEEMAAAMIANMKEKTGKSLPEWLEIAAGSGLAKHGEIVKYLKTEHGMTHGFAGLVAHKTLASDAGSSTDQDLIAAQYAGAKSGLRPILDAVLEGVSAFGGEVEIAPKKAYVSLRHNKQFAIIQPSTKTRVDIGINLKGVDPTERLEASGSFNSMVSHRVRVGTVDEVDEELLQWLLEAYESG